MQTNNIKVVYKTPSLHLFLLNSESSCILTSTNSAVFKFIIMYLYKSKKQNKTKRNKTKNPFEIDIYVAFFRVTGVLNSPPVYGTNTIMSYCYFLTFITRELKNVNLETISPTPC